jgi:hypothetical protein
VSFSDRAISAAGVADIARPAALSLALAIGIARRRRSWRHP